MSKAVDTDDEAELPDLLVDPAERNRWLRFVEALLFASADPIDESELRRRVPEEINVRQLLADLAEHYAERGVVLTKSGTRWAFRTAVDLGPMLRHERAQRRKLSRAAIETLAIIAYHQPTTRAEIEEIRGVALSKGTIDTLLEAGWIAPRGRRETPGRPLQWGTTNAFLDHFGLDSVKELPGIEELRAAGLLDRRTGATSIAMQQEDLEDDEEEDEDIQLDFLPDTNDPDEGDKP
ncbi:SMC-Scp complex subunit ScpB [Thalassobaculum sp.]|jgi:segregation and condensation protein B|uniref:SMC-Scp complex subunit ScpB n=1 Tax=Thalassobaculum sp. TaxID=2022740 RepID=UPI003B5B9539